MINSKTDFLFEKWETFSQAKITKWPQKNVERNTKLLDLIHTNLCEFERILCCGGSRYFITFIDDFSTYTHVYLLKNKSDALNKFQDFLREVENQSVGKLKYLKVIDCESMNQLDSNNLFSL